jgi:hypothetical protein
MSNYKIADCKKLINESGLPYQIVRKNGIYRLIDLHNVPNPKKIEEGKRRITEALMAPAITNVDELYKQLSLEAEELAKNIAEIQKKQEVPLGLNDEALAEYTK